MRNGTRFVSRKDQLVFRAVFQLRNFPLTPTTILLKMRGMVDRRHRVRMQRERRWASHLSSVACYQPRSVSGSPLYGIDAFVYPMRMDNPPMTGIVPKELGVLRVLSVLVGYR